MAAWFDIGVNLPDKRLVPDTVISNAIANDVQGMLLIGTSVEHSKETCQLAANYPSHAVCSVGVHPHNAKDVTADFIEQLATLASHPNVVALGECGLDFNRNFSPADSQLTVFEQQLQLACSLGLPVYLHERDALSEQIALLKKYRSSLPAAIVHCFTGDHHALKAYLDLDCHIGITGWVCDPKRGTALRSALPDIPLDKLLLETDAPYLWPKTLKSKSRNNSPANIPHIGEFVANLIEVEPPLLKQHVWNNTIRVFGLEAMYAE